MVPVSATGTPSSSAVIPEAMTPEVLPWSCAVPMVVYRLMCSMERRPAPTARAMSATVASRCRSTNCVAPSAAVGSGTRHSTSGAARLGGRSGGGRRSVVEAGSARRAHAPAARCPSARHPAQVEHAGRGTRRRSGRRAARRARRRRAARRSAAGRAAWLNRCTAGFQPPLTSSRSQAMASLLADRCRRCTGRPGACGDPLVRRRVRRRPARPAPGSRLLALVPPHAGIRPAGRRRRRRPGRRRRCRSTAAS